MPLKFRSDECQKLTSLMQEASPRPFQSFIQPLPWDTTRQVSAGGHRVGDHADALLLLVPSSQGSEAFLQCAWLAKQRVGTWAASYST